MVDVGEQSPKEAGGRIPGHVLVTAARLFSEVGYDETTTQLIADACGIDASVVRDAYGGQARRVPGRHGAVDPGADGTPGPRPRRFHP
ncbi:helix-turn-helix domain-containing protein [Actinomadura madurae]|uniref:helix-turn-helix domain-containing protein n=1 Tax=Actinomadura madurae TaxID=1993 RepID=UPI003558E47A